MKKYFFPILITTTCLVGVVFLSGCTSINVKPVANVSAIKHVCIKECPEDCYVEELPTVIAEGFERHGISTQIFTGEVPAHCEYHLNFMCNRTWHYGMSMNHAEVWLFQGSTQIGSAVYHRRGEEGFALMTRLGTKAKMDPVIDELLGK
ncbi:MAG: hypothetical protein FWG62_02725 [Proteobacteria bacterium]|nr:hypothetical protein [Pseudomonadota bacterium]